jgi:hypothetical protein
MESPILPFVAASSYSFGGVPEWIRRIQAVIFFHVVAVRRIWF